MIKLIAKFLARPAVVDWLIARAKLTPYSHLPSDTNPSYMERYWLFNPYPKSSPDGKKSLRRLLPSIRLHHIKRHDLDEHMHDHPWDARTFILRGGYHEIKQVRPFVRLGDFECFDYYFIRQPGDTATLNFYQFHRITEVSPGGVWTLFVTWQYRGTWGFLVDGGKVKWRDYMGIPK